MRREERQGILKVERREWIIPKYFNNYYSIPLFFSFLLIISSVLPIILIIFFKMIVHNTNGNYSVVCQMLSLVMRKHIPRSTHPPDYLRSIIDS